MATHRFVWLFV